MCETVDGQVYLTTQEAAGRIGVSADTIRRWARLGWLPARKFGTQLFILEKDIKALLEVDGVGGEVGGVENQVGANGKN